MRKILIHCPINCEIYCLHEIESKIDLRLRKEYSIKIFEQGILELKIIAKSKEKFIHWIEILTNCITIEILRLELENREIPYKLQNPRNQKHNRILFLEKCFQNALVNLIQIISTNSLEIVSNTQYWKEFSQRDIQAIFKKVAKNQVPHIQILLKKANSELHIKITRQFVKITLDIPTQKWFIPKKIHPTPSFPSIAYVMFQIAFQYIQRYLKSSVESDSLQIVDAMCGAGTLSLVAAKVLNNIRMYSHNIDGFDNNQQWVISAQENARNLNLPNINFHQWDLLTNDFKLFPFSHIDIILSHPPYGYFVQYDYEILIQLYKHLLLLFKRFGTKKGCLVVNTPREDILKPLIENLSLKLVKTMDIPRKKTIVKLWLIIKE
ncbi:MAG: methyltransferase domain-containing protein [Candidatus Hermodarchaeota archaeon]